ncbi:MAG: C-GCAxxG-C-C family protein [Anaerolineales bacterium]|nr:C-GCAxxG-C-C family protein [Anaerolineales bacterium]
MGVVDRSFDQPLRREECAVMPLAGGLMGNGYQCGMLWGGALAAGAQAYRLYGSGPQAEAEAMIASQRLVEAFRARAKEINCAEITEIEWKMTSKREMATQVLKFFVRGGPVGCFRLAADYAQIAFDEINISLSEKHVEELSHPASCAAMLAQKMGASGMHTVMAAVSG